MTVLGGMGAFNGPALSAVLTALVAVIHDLEQTAKLEESRGWQGQALP